VVYAAPADTAMRKVLSYATDRKIPFVVTFGNHDNEQGKTHAELYDVIRSMPFNIQPDRGGVESPDYVLTLKSSDGKKDAALLYCL
ncbi:UNVERIFIED_CONTAM: metallophosphatase, partial [Prevotella sp. 15_C9]